MKKTLFLAALVLIGSAASQVHAGPPAPAAAPAAAPAPAAVPMFTYDFLDVNYIYTDFDYHGLDDAHGIGVNLSKSVGGPVYLTGSFEWSDTTDHYEPIDLYGASGGLGVYLPVVDRLHINFEGGAIWAKVDHDYYSEDDWGFFVGPGARFAICQGFEVFANVYYSDFGGHDTDSIDVNVGAIFDLSQYFGIKVGGLFSDDQNQAFVGGRIYY